ncbi:MAG: hypothetical protein ACKV2T_02350 [Kofleriaceae bacterium]
MPRTLVAIAFIAGTGAAAVVMAQKKTVIRGDVMAAELHTQLEKHGITDVSCEDAPVEDHGAVFLCRVAAKDGSRATIEYTMDRKGAFTAKQLGDTTQDHPDEPEARDPNADPWSR